MAKDQVAARFLQEPKEILPSKSEICKDMEEIRVNRRSHIDSLDPDSDWGNFIGRERGESQRENYFIHVHQCSGVGNYFHRDHLFFRSSCFAGLDKII